MAHIIGLDSWTAWMDSIPHEVEAEVKVVVADTAYKVEADAKMLCPVDTGHLRRSINTDIASDGLSAQVGTNVDYAPSVEFGSAPHIINVNNKQVLSDGQHVFGKTVHHPGTPAQPFLTPAYVKHKDDFEKELKKILDSVGD